MKPRPTIQQEAFKNGGENKNIYENALTKSNNPSMTALKGVQQETTKQSAVMSKRNS